MQDRVFKEISIADLEPGWSEEAHDQRQKTSFRTQGSLNLSLMKVSKTPENNRKYVPGDPINLIDWKVYARTDQVTVREHRDEASANVSIYMDLGTSMHWPDPAMFLNQTSVPPIKKSEMAIRVGFWLAYSHLTQGDTVTCYLLLDDRSQARIWRPRNSAEVLSIFMSSKFDLCKLVPEYFVNSEKDFKKSDTCWLLSDCLNLTNLNFIETRNRKLILLHILSSLELSTDWMEPHTCYIDHDSIRKDFLGSQLKEGSMFTDSVEKWRHTWEKQLRTLGGRYFLATDTTPATSFFHFLAQRVSS